MSVRGWRPSYDHQAPLLTAFTISTAGDWLYRLTLPLLVLDITGSPVSTAVTYALEFVPYVFFSVLGGVVADRFDRRRVLLLGDVCSAVIVAGMAFMVTAGVTSVWAIYATAFSLSSVRPFYHPAFQAYLPTLVPAAGLTRANARVQTAESVLQFLGPVVGVGTVTALGAAFALWANTVSFLLSGLLILCIRKRADATVCEKRSPSPQDGLLRSISRDIKESVQYMRTDRVVLSASVLMAGTNVGLYLVEANLVYFLTRTLGHPVSAVGFAFAAYGLGAVIGASVIPHVLNRVRPGPVIVGGMAAAGAATLLLGFSESLVMVCLGWGMAGAFLMALVVSWFTLRQQIVPNRLLGRVVAVSRMLAFLTIAPAAAFGGLMLAGTDAVWPLIGCSAGVQLAVAGVAAFTRLRTAEFPSPGDEPVDEGEKKETTTP